MTLQGAVVLRDGCEFRFLPKAAIAVLIIDSMTSLLKWQDAKTMWTVRVPRNAF